MKISRIQILVEIALFAALALILDIALSPSFGIVKLSFKMLPIIILALRHGLVPGIIGGILWAVLQLVTGNATVIHAMQFIVEYPLAFGLIGLAGVFRRSFQYTLANETNRRMRQIGIASVALILGSFTRYIVHFFAGIYYWGQYAPEAQGPVLYSLIVNGSNFLSETIITLIVLALLAPFYNQLVKTTSLSR